MLGTILNFIEMLLKKYGMISLVSFIAGIATVTIIPNEKIEILPFGKQNIYWAFVTAIIAWIIIISFIQNSIKKILRGIATTKYKINNSVKQSIETKQKIHEIVDSFSEREREILNELVTNGNKPITLSESDFDYNMYKIKSFPWLDISEKRTAVSEEFTDFHTGKKVQGTAYHSHIAILKPDVFACLKEVQKEDGKLGHF